MDGLGAGTRYTTFMEMNGRRAVANGGYGKLCTKISSLVWLVRSTEFSIPLVLRQLRRLRNAHSVLVENCYVQAWCDPFTSSPAATLIPILYPGPILSDNSRVGLQKNFPTVTRFLVGQSLAASLGLWGEPRS